MKTSFLIYLIAIGLSALVGWLGILSKKIDRNLYFIVYAVTFSLCEELLAYYLKIRFHNNIWLYYIGGLFEYALFSLFIFYNSPGKFLNKFIPFSIMIFFVYLTINAIVSDNIYTNSFLNVAMKGFALAICAIMYIGNLFLNNDRIFKLNVSVLIIVTGILFYYSFSAIFFSILKYLADTPAKYLNPDVKRIVNQVYPLLHTINLILYCSITIALLISMRKKKSTKDNSIHFRSAGLNEPN